MTTAGEPPPPLPPGDDPFALLGVAEDASDKDIRKAYAKRIKVYRPDRSPAEFQRIQRAFEMLSTGRAFELRRAEPAADRAGDQPAPSADAEEQAGASISAAFVEIQAAAVRGDSAEVDRIIGSLLDRKVSLEKLFADPDNHELLFRSTAITWTRLGDHDRPGRWAVWNETFDRAYAKDPVRAAKMLDDAELRHAVADDPMVAVMVLDRLASLAWRGEVRPIVELFETYRESLPRHDVVAHRADGLLLHLEARAQLEDVALPPMLAGLPELIKLTTIGSHEEQRAAAIALRDALAADVPRSLEKIEEWAKANQHGAQPTLRELLVHSLSSHRRRLDAMPKRRFDALTKALHRAGAGVPTKHKLAMLALTVGLSVIQLPETLALPVVIGVFFFATEGWRFETQIAPAVAGVILKVPVLSSVITRWVQINPKLRGRLGRYDIGIDNSWGLYTFSLLVAYAAEVGGLDAHLDED